MSDYAFHPEAFADIDQLWEYIAEHNIDGADQVVAEVHRKKQGRLALR